MALIDDSNKKTTMKLSEIVNIGGCKLIETTDSDTKQRYKLETLDSLNFEKIDFIKLDVEGQELNVLNGGVNTILKYRPIIFFECWAIDSGHWKNIPNTHNELMAYIKSLNYIINKVNIDGNDNYEAIPNNF